MVCPTRCAVSVAWSSRRFGVREAHRSSGRALQCAMHGARVAHEVHAGQRMRGEKFRWQPIAFQAVTAAACEDDVARVMRTAVGEWIDVIESGGVKVQRGAAVHATAAAVAHGCTFDRALVARAAKVADSRGGAFEARAGKSGESGKHDAVILSANGHFTSLEKATPRTGKASQSGAFDLFGVVDFATKGARRDVARRYVSLSCRRCRTSVRTPQGWSLRGTNVMAARFAQERISVSGERRVTRSTSLSSGGGSIVLRLRRCLSVEIHSSQRRHGISQRRHDAHRGCIE